MNNDKEKRLERILEVMSKYGKILSKLSDEMEKIGLEENIEHIGKTSSIVKVLIGSMENPYVLDEFNNLCRMFAAKEILDKLNDETNGVIRKNLIESYKEDLD